MERKKGLGSGNGLVAGHMGKKRYYRLNKLHSLACVDVWFCFALDFGDSYSSFGLVGILRFRATF